MIINLHLRQNKYIEILKHLEKDIGKARLLEMLKKRSSTSGTYTELLCNRSSS